MTSLQYKVSRACIVVFLVTIILCTGLYFLDLGRYGWTAWPISVVAAVLNEIRIGRRRRRA